MDNLDVMFYMLIIQGICVLVMIILFVIQIILISKNENDAEYPVDEKEEEASDEPE